MAQKMSAALAAAVAAESRQVPPQDKLERLREAARRQRDLEREAADLTARQEEVAAALNALRFAELPDLFDEVGVSAVTLAAEGNLPAYAAELKPYYSANISTKWDAERRRAGYEALLAEGAGDLIKTTVTLSFGRQELNVAQDAAKKLRDLGFAPELEMGVHPQTLTAWLRERVERTRSVPPLEPIGGTVGRVVKMKQVK